MAKFMLMTFIFNLFCFSVFGASITNQPFQQFATNHFDQQKCDFPPQFVFIKHEDEREDFPVETCERDGSFTQDLCQKIIELSNIVCSISDVQSRVSEKEFMTAGWNHKPEDVKAKVQEMCQSPEFQHLAKRNVQYNCTRDCLESYKVCDLYYAMDKAERSKFKGITDFKQLSMYMHSSRHAYPPMGSITSADAPLHDCLNQTNADAETKQLCTAVLNVTACFSDKHLPEMNEGQFLLDTDSDSNPCGQFPTVHCLNSETFKKLANATHCSLICETRMSICKALYLGIKAIEEAEKENKNEATPELQDKSDTGGSGSKKEGLAYGLPCKPDKTLCENNTECKKDEKSADQFTCQCLEGYKPDEDDKHCLQEDSSSQTTFTDFDMVSTTESQITDQKTEPKKTDQKTEPQDTDQKTDDVSKEEDKNTKKDSDDKQPSKSIIQNKYEEEEKGGLGFLSYFMVFTVLVVAGYLVFHNKQKIIALVVEGKNRGRNGRRPNTKEYRQLKTEDVMPSLEKTASSKNYVF